MNFFGEKKKKELNKNENKGIDRLLAKSLRYAVRAMSARVFEVVCTVGETGAK